MTTSLKWTQIKTELILIGGMSSPWHSNFWPPSLGNAPEPASSAKSLGIVISNDLSLNAQIGSVVSASFFQLQRINKISRFLSRDALTLVILALVISRLDYANSLYVGIPAYQQRRLQLIQNQAARLIFHLPKWQHVRMILKNLHWLPVSLRCTFKLGCTIFKALHGNSPAFISSRIQRYVPSRDMRSSHLNLLVRPSFKRKKLGVARFATVAPQFWNSLPVEMRLATSYAHFRKMLKT